MSEPEDKSLASSALDSIRRYMTAEPPNAASDPTPTATTISHEPLAGPVEPGTTWREHNDYNYVYRINDNTGQTSSFYTSSRPREGFYPYKSADGKTRYMSFTAHRQTPTDVNMTKDLPEIQSPSYEQELKAPRQPGSDKIAPGT